MPDYGRYTRAEVVTSGSTVWTTGSLVGNIAMVSAGTNYVLELAISGTISGSFLDAGKVHELEVKKVTSNSDPVTVLYKHV